MSSPGCVLLTFSISALLDPQDTKTAQRQFCMTGKVRVILWGGGLGESLIAATHFLVSCKTCFHVTFSYNVSADNVQIVIANRCYINIFERC